MSPVSETETIAAENEETRLLIRSESTPVGFDVFPSGRRLIDSVRSVTSRLRMSMHREHPTLLQHVASMTEHTKTDRMF